MKKAADGFFKAAEVAMVLSAMGAAWIGARLAGLAAWILAKVLRPVAGWFLSVDWLALAASAAGMAVGAVILIGKLAWGAAGGVLR